MVAEDLSLTFIGCCQDGSVEEHWLGVPRLLPDACPSNALMEQLRPQTDVSQEGCVIVRWLDTSAGQLGVEPVL